MSLRKNSFANFITSLCTGVVLAVNARLVAMNPQPFVSIMKEMPELQILIWTGTGEPQISKRKIMSIKTYFESEGFIDRIGFDCKVCYPNCQRLFLFMLHSN